MTERKPEVLGVATFDQHHGIRVDLVFRGLKGEPIERMYLTSTKAAELAESLIRSVKQAIR